jgi:hypothetical protein
MISFAATSPHPQPSIPPKSPNHIGKRNTNMLSQNLRHTPPTLPQILFPVLGEQDRKTTFLGERSRCVIFRRERVYTPVVYVVCVPSCFVVSDEGQEERIGERYDIWRYGDKRQGNGRQICKESSRSGRQLKGSTASRSRSQSIPP